VQLIIFCAVTSLFNNFQVAIFPSEDRGKTGESLFLPKDFFELPSRKKSAKTTRPLMPSAPRFVRVTSFRPNKGSKLWLSHDLTPFRDALQVFSASLRKPARRYGYRGLKIFTSLTLRFQDFQRAQR
jgi:hypothetical protein